MLNSIQSSFGRQKQGFGVAFPGISKLIESNPRITSEETTDVVNFLEETCKGSGNKDHAPIINLLELGHGYAKALVGEKTQIEYKRANHLDGGGTIVETLKGLIAKTKEVLAPTEQQKAMEKASRAKKTIIETAKPSDYYKGWD